MKNYKEGEGEDFGLKYFLRGLAHAVNTRTGAVAVCSFLSLLWFVVEWCMMTTFRPMSTWMLWICNLFISMLLILPYMFTGKVWLQLTVQALVDFLLLANLMYCRTYFNAIPPDSYSLVGNLREFTDSVTDSLRWMDLGFLLILVGEGIWAYRFAPRRDNRPRSWICYIVLTLTSGGAYWATIGLKGGFYKAYSDLISACYTTTSGVPTYTVFGHILFCYKEKERSYRYGLQWAENWLSAHERFHPTHTLPDSVEPRRNLVLILLESFETWPIGKSIGGKEITPNLNKMVTEERTLYAPRVLTQVDAGRSSDAQLMITAGLLPMEQSVFATRYPKTFCITLPKVMRDYRKGKSAILSVDQKVTWNYAVTAKTYGYETILERNDWEHDEVIKQHLSDRSFFKQSVEKIKGGLWPEGEPMMITMLSYSGHSPFVIPPVLRDKDFNLGGMGLNRTLEDYLQAVHYVDAQLPIIIDYLKSRSDWGETLVAITGDHEGLAMQRGEIRKSSAEAAAMVDAGQYTPLIILNSPISGRYEHVMGQIDIFPTLMELLGFDECRWRGVGQSIFDENKIKAAISSMTRTIEGDTVGIDPERRSHWERARTMSDEMIRGDLIGTIYSRGGGGSGGR